MTIDVGYRLPGASLLHMGADRPETVDLAARLAGRKVVIFGVPGAFTPTCDSAHVPSFIRVMDALRDKGVDEVICLSVNDAHVMRAWGESTGATAAGITMLADADGVVLWSAGGGAFREQAERADERVHGGAEPLGVRPGRLAARLVRRVGGARGHRGLRTT